ncbi:hypothetical protein BGZ76_011255, partial [Entomortierella beljakovae]
FCENGSLRSLCKNFGKLPEHLGAMYITQVLEGLIYLHDQGVIHRDIKGANILATKDGLIKLADFGVATLSTDNGDLSVAGTPYWMAPEIIELSGATTASDIWSVGCTMVRDFLTQCFQKDCNLRVSAKKLLKHPWIQTSKKKASGSQRSREKGVPAFDDAVKSVQQWNEALKKSGTVAIRSSGNMRRGHSDKNGSRSWERGVPPISELFQGRGSQGKEHSGNRQNLQLQLPHQHQQGRPVSMPTSAPPPQFRVPSHPNNVTAVKATKYEPEENDDIWDDDFAGGISSFQIAAREFRDQEDEISKTIRATPRRLQEPDYAEDNDVYDDVFDVTAVEEIRLKVKAKGKKRSSKLKEASIKPGGSLASRAKAPGPFVPIDLVRSRSAPGQLTILPLPIKDDFESYREVEDINYSDLIEDAERKGAMYPDEGLSLQTRLSNQSWYGNDAGSDEEDPFAEVDEGFDEIDMEANIAREKYAKISTSIGEQFRLLELQNNEKQREAVCDQLITLLTENPDIRGPMITNHGAIPLLDLIENSSQQSLILKLLNILNLVTRKDFALQESLCLVGAIPVLTEYTSSTKQYSKEIQLAAAIFIEQICHTNPLTLQMFISCRGLRVLIDFLRGNYSKQKDLVWIAINGIHSVFNLQSMTPRNDFCRLLAKQGLLDPLSTTLHKTIRDPQGGPYTEKIVQILLFFSQGDSPVKELLAKRKIIHCMLNSLQSLPPHLCVMMLKCIKNISMNSNTLDELQISSSIHTLVEFLSDYTGPFTQDVNNHILTTLFNLCRINKSRQEEAAQAGVIPILQQMAESNSPLKQFALPILCDMAHAGRVCRSILWTNDTLPCYIRIFKDPYWQVNAMDAVHVWLQDETADVEQVLIKPVSLQMFVQAFLTAKANSFENILEPLHKIIRLSPAVARGIAVPTLFQRLLDRLAHPKAVVRLNLLRILRAIFDVHPAGIELVVRYGISGVVNRIAEEDNAVLVKELAKDIQVAFNESDSEAVLSSDDRDRSLNGFDSISSSTGDFFGLKNLVPAKVGGEFSSSPVEEIPQLQQQQQLIQGKLKEKDIDPDQHTVDDLFQNEVDELDINTGLDPRRSPHQRGFGHEGNGEGSSSSSSQMRRLPPFCRRDSNEDGSDDSNSDDLFVTTRPWIDSNDTPTVAMRLPSHLPPRNGHNDSIEDPMAARTNRLSGHHKSKSLTEILEEDYERSQLRQLDNHTTDLSESMILRRELPKIRLELLDIEQYTWNRRELEAKYENDEEDDTDVVAAAAAAAIASANANNRGGVGQERSRTFRTSWSESGQDLKGVNWRRATDEPESNKEFRTANWRGVNDDLSFEEQARVTRAFQGKRRLSMDDKIGTRNNIGNGIVRGRRRASGSNSNEPTHRYQGTPIGSLSSQSNGHGARQAPSLASIVGWNTQMSLRMTKKEEIREEPPAQGLVLAKRQEYDDTLNFSDDSDENDIEGSGSEGNEGNEEDNNEDEEEDAYESAEEDEGEDEDDNDNDDDEKDEDSDDEGGESEEEVEEMGEQEQDGFDNDDRTIRASFITLNNGNHSGQGSRSNGHNVYDDNVFEDDRNNHRHNHHHHHHHHHHHNNIHSNTESWKEQEQDHNSSINYGGFLTGDGEIDWEREEVRKGYDSPKSTVVSSTVTSPASSTSSLRRRTSYRRTSE